MKKVFKIISCILLITMLASCANNSENVKENNTSAESKTYAIYFNPYSGVTLKEEQDTTDITFKDARTKVFTFADKTKISRPSDADDLQTLELNGKTYSLQYSKTCETALSSSKNFKEYSKFNTYKSDTIQADTRVSTNELLFFANLDQNDSIVTGDLTEEEAKIVADATILSLYGESAQQEYTYETTVYTNSQLTVQYTVVYRKYVWGMPTNDAIQISVNMKGDVVAINARSLGMFSLAESQIDKKAIDDAISTLQATFSENWTIGTTMLVLDAEGDYYISAKLFRKNTQGIEAMEVFINII